MSLNSRSGLVMAAFAALLVANFGCSSSKKKDASGGTGGNVDGGKVDGQGGTGGDAGGTGGTGGGTGGDAGVDKGDTGGTGGTDGGGTGGTGGTDGGGTGGTGGAMDAAADKSDAADTGGTGGGMGGTGGGTGGTGGGTGGTGGATDGGAIDTACTPECTAGDKRCGAGGGLQTCAGTCGKWGAEAPCGAHSVCAGASPTAACQCNPTPTECASVTTPATVCADSTHVVTCDSAVESGNTCVFSTPTETCSAGSGGYKTCQVQGSAGASCACANTCAVTDLGSYCKDGQGGALRNLCVFTADGCFVDMDSTQCVLPLRCYGPTGAAACRCNVDVFDKGDGMGGLDPAANKVNSGCSSASEGKKRCDGTTVSVCTKSSTPDFDHPGEFCYWMTADTACPSGFTCTRDPDYTALGSTNPPLSSMSTRDAHCGCPDVTDGNFFVHDTDGHDNTFSILVGTVPVTIRSTGSNSSTKCNYQTIKTAAQAHAQKWEDDPSTGGGANEFACGYGQNNGSAGFVNSGECNNDTDGDTDTVSRPANIILNHAGGTYPIVEDHGGYGDAVHIKEHVTLTNNADGASPGMFVVESQLTGNGPQWGMVMTGVGGAKGFRMTYNPGDTNRTWGHLMCTSLGSSAPGSQRTISNVILDGHDDTNGGMVYDGLWIDNGCEVTADNVTIGGSDTDTNASGFQGKGIDIHKDGKLTSNAGLAVRNVRVRGLTVHRDWNTATAKVNLTDSVIENCGQGIHSQDGTGAQCLENHAMITLQGVTIQNNRGQGIYSRDTNLTIKESAAGSSVLNANGLDWNTPQLAVWSNNSESGTGCHTTTAAFLDMSGGTEVKDGYSGVLIGNHLGSMNRVLVHGNTGGGGTSNAGDGVVIRNQDGTQTFDMTSSCEFNNNTGDGLRIESSPQTTGGSADLIRFLNGKIHDNGTVSGSSGGWGIQVDGAWLDGTNGSATLTVKGSSIYGNGYGGIRVHASSSGLTRTTIQSSRIHENNLLAPMNDSDGAGRAGVYFDGPSSLATFYGNRLYLNRGPEMRFNSETAGLAGSCPSGAEVGWDVTSQSNLCDATSNMFSCYSGIGDLAIAANVGGCGGTGSFTDGSVKVDARWNQWLNPMPSNGVDFSDNGAMTVNFQATGSGAAASPCMPVDCDTIKLGGP